MYFPEDSDDELEINIVPMIDVIFAILTFFIISSLFLSRTQSLPVNLPKADSAEVRERIRIIVTVEESGDLSLNENPIEIADLRRDINELGEDIAEFAIVINADEAVNHGRVIEVMDELREIEGATLGIATQRPSAEAEAD